VPVVSAPHGYNEDQLYVDLRQAFGHPLFLKCEGFNFAGSIKLKAATEMVEAAEGDGTLRPDSILVESSSGNLASGTAECRKRERRIELPGAVKRLSMRSNG